MTRAGGALRGGVAAVVWAAFFLTTGAALLRMIPATRSVLGVGYLLEYFAPTADDPAKWLHFLGAAGIGGLIVGLIGSRLRSDPWRRGAAMWVAFYPAGGLGLATIMLLNPAGWRATSLADLIFLPVGMTAVGFLFAAFGLVFFPLLSLPLLAAALTTEAWTRPENMARSPLAQHPVKTAMVGLLVSIAGGSLLYLWASSHMAPGTTWLVP
jgi:hypothetical protein